MTHERVCANCLGPLTATDETETVTISGCERHVHRACLIPPGAEAWGAPDEVREPGPGDTMRVDSGDRIRITIECTVDHLEYGFLGYDPVFINKHVPGGFNLMHSVLRGARIELWKNPHPRGNRP